MRHNHKGAGLAKHCVREHRRASGVCRVGGIAADRADPAVCRGVREARNI